MSQLPNSADQNIGKSDSTYNRLEVVLFDAKHWSYIQRRYLISPREVQVAKLVCHGFSNKEIAQDLNIELGTVKTHLRNIYRRVRVKNKVALLLTFINDIDRLFYHSPNAGFIPVMTNKSESMSKTSGL
jgi:DNA-binding NarL/FixJ family response regulator